MNEPIPAPPPHLEMTSDQRLWAVLCHVSLLLGVGIILPIIVYLVKKSDDQVIATHAAEALNFHLSYLIWTFVCLPLVFIVIGIPMIFAVIIAEFVLCIVGTIKAADNQLYHYPLTIRFVG